MSVVEASPTMVRGRDRKAWALEERQAIAAREWLEKFRLATVRVLWLVTARSRRFSCKLQVIVWEVHLRIGLDMMVGLNWRAWAAHQVAAASALDQKTVVCVRMATQQTAW